MSEKAAELWYYKQIGAWISLTCLAVACLVLVAVAVWNENKNKKGR